MDLYDRVVARTVERGGTTLALGGLDSGKTSFCRLCVAVAVRLGRPVAYVATSVEDRASHRQEGLRRFFEPPLNHWKVKTSVLVPSIPPELDPASLDRLLVGLEDGKGNCIGLGILELREDGLHMMSTEGEGAKALRLGSVRVTEDYGTTSVDLRDIFISD